MRKRQHLYKTMNRRFYNEEGECEKMSIRQMCPFTNTDCKAICNLWNTQFNQCSLFLLATAEHRASIEIAAKVNNLTVAVNELAKKLDNPNGIVGDALIKAIVAKREADTSNENGQVTNRGTNSSYKPQAKDVIDKYFKECLDEDSWKTFVNAKTKDVYKQFVEWVKKNGIDVHVEQSMFTRAVLRKYGREIQSDNTNGGTYRLM